MVEAVGIRWNAWEPGTLARAGAEGKLIFLDIAAFSNYVILSNRRMLHAANTIQ